jgi:hypothetical protein
MSRGCEKCQFSETVDYATYRCRKFGNEWPELACSRLVLKKDESEGDDTMTSIDACHELEKLRAEHARLKDKCMDYRDHLKAIALGVISRPVMLARKCLQGEESDE